MRDDPKVFEEVSVFSLLIFISLKKRNSIMLVSVTKYSHGQQIL